MPTATASSRSCEQVAGTSEVDALTRAQVQDVYDALEELIERRPRWRPPRPRRSQPYDEYSNGLAKAQLPLSSQANGSSSTTSSSATSSVPGLA